MSEGGGLATGSAPASDAVADPPYFESSWSILSTIGIANVLFGIVIIGITSLKPVVVVPIVCSAAAALANGLCFYGFYTTYPVVNRAVASGFADIFWLIQEGGLPLYSYVILRRILRDKQRLIFLTLFWTFITCLAAVRIAVTALRIRYILEGEEDFQQILTRLHIAFFVLLACVEILSAFFLLRKFATAKTTSMKAALRTGLFQYLMRSTEVRVALLAFIGVTRSITYSFQTTPHKRTTAVGQFDQFVYTMESLFPIMLYFDILASKLQVGSQSLADTSGTQQKRQKKLTSQLSSRMQRLKPGSHDQGYLSSKSKPGGNILEVQSRLGRPQSQERLAEQGHSSRTASEDANAPVLPQRDDSGIVEMDELTVAKPPGSPP